jgi:hypothetical protein
MLVVPRPDGGEERDGVATLASFHDTLTAYRCSQCQQVFYTVALRCAAQEPIVDPLEQRGGPLTRHAARQDATPATRIFGGQLPFGRRLRRP